MMIEWLGERSHRGLGCEKRVLVLCGRSLHLGLFSESKSPEDEAHDLEIHRLVLPSALGQPRHLQSWSHLELRAIPLEGYD